MNSVPIRVPVQPDASLSSWLKGLRLQQMPLLKYEHTPPLEVQRCSEVPHGTSLFETVLNFADYSLNETLRGLGSRWRRAASTSAKKPTTRSHLRVGGSRPDAEDRVRPEPFRRCDDSADARPLQDTAGKHGRQPRSACEAIYTSHHADSRCCSSTGTKPLATTTATPA